MKDLMIPDYMIMDFEFGNERFTGTHIHQNVEMFIMLKGKGRLLCDEKEYSVSEGDYQVVNSNKRHGFSSGTDVLYAWLQINFVRLSELTDMNTIEFDCRAGHVKEETDRRIRRDLRHIFNRYFNRRGSDQIRLNVYYYDLLDVLVNACVVYRQDAIWNVSRKQTEQERLNKIVNYVYANYRNEISLKELAKKMYLTEAYLSKYIKSHLGMTFREYVNNVRLYWATDDLEHTEKTLTQISVDNGFASPATFNRAFEAMYHIKPVEYRRQSAARPEDEEAGRKKEEEIAESVRSFLEENDNIIRQESFQEGEVSADAVKPKYYLRCWDRMINFDRVSTLRLGNAREQVLFLKKELGFEYVRVWDIYAEDLHLDPGEGENRYNFTRMDEAFDFLVENQIHPYIELGNKPDVLVEKLDGYIRWERREPLFRSLEDYREFLFAMVGHYVSRYGLREVEKWYFEQWKDSEPETKDEDYSGYFRLFETSFRVIKSFSQNIRVGGGSLHHTFDRDDYEHFISCWAKQLARPDFLTLYSYPYTTEKSGAAVDSRRSQDPDFLKNQIREVKEILSEYREMTKEIHVSEWNSSVSNRNIINDSCYKGAWVMRSILDNIGNLDLLGYWLASDIFAQEKDTDRFLTGGVGLVTKDGVKKPAFYAYRFLSRLGAYEIGRDEHSFVTSCGEDEYSIVLHNCKNPGYRYYAEEENRLDPGNQEQYFEDWTSLKQNVRIFHVRNGRYRVRIWRVCQEEGSILDKWIRLGKPAGLTREDTAWFRQSCIPKLEIRELEVWDETVHFTTILKPNEIQHVQITYQIRI